MFSSRSILLLAYVVNYYLVTFGIVRDRHADTRPDGTRRIRADHALAEVGSKATLPQQKCVTQVHLSQSHTKEHTLVRIDYGRYRHYPVGRGYWMKLQSSL